MKMNTNFLNLVSENQSGWFDKAMYRKEHQAELDAIAEKIIYLLRKMRKYNVTKFDLQKELNISVISYPLDCDVIIEYLDNKFE